MAALFTFYRNFAYVSNAITLFCCYLIWLNDSWSYISVTFWIKVVTNIVSGVYIHLFQNDQYHFFNNLGYSVWGLYGSTFAMDFVLWVVLSILTTSFL